MTSLLLGLSLGFAAGISPGPLLTLVITSTLARGFRAGLRVAVAPLLTDLPIILISALLFGALPGTLEIALSAAGGLLVMYLGLATVRSARHARLEPVAAATQPAAVDLWHGVLVNALSPHPWLFWITIGGPILIGAWQISGWHAFAFLLGFYSLLVGGKIMLAIVVAGGRRYLSDVWYRRLLVSGGLILCLFGALLFWRLVQPIL